MHVELFLFLVGLLLGIQDLRQPNGLVLDALFAVDLVEHTCRDLDLGILAVKETSTDSKALPGPRLERLLVCKELKVLFRDYAERLLALAIDGLCLLHILASGIVVVIRLLHVLANHYGDLGRADVE